MWESDLAIGIITISSTAFTILFGVVTLFPPLVSFIENTDIERRVELLRKREYRFLKRLIEGRSMILLLATVNLFLVSNVASVIFLWSRQSLILTISTIICLSTLLVLIGVILITFLQSSEPTGEEYDLITEFIPTEEDP